MGVDYGYQCFYKAVYGAIAGTDTLQRRLRECVREVQHLQRDSFPSDDIFTRFRMLIDRATQLPERHPAEGTLTATTAQMTDAEAKRCLHEFCDLFSDITEAYGRSLLGFRPRT